jgi:hypothetical protein
MPDRGKDVFAVVELFGVVWDRLPVERKVV